MNYKQIYFNLLLKHGTESKPEGYSERHHIVPKSMGGGDSKDNLIYLSARVHFIAHWLLFKRYRNPQMARAFFGMADKNRRPERAEMVTSRRYEIAKKAFIENNHMQTHEFRESSRLKAELQWKNNYEEMKASNAFMFSDVNSPMNMIGKTGALHPISRAVITPLGEFESVTDAARAHGVVTAIISKKAKSDSILHQGYYWKDAPVIGTENDGRNAHHLRKSVSTPFGNFESVREAGKVMGIHHSTISKRIRRGDQGYSYIN